MISDFNFSDQSGKSYYCNTILGFVKDNPNEILGSLTKFGAKYGFDRSQSQINAWIDQIEVILK